MSRSRRNLFASQNSVSIVLYKTFFHAFRIAGKPLGRLRSRTPLQTALDKVARKAYPDSAGASWVRNRWGDELRLSYFYHLDREILLGGTYDYVMHRVIERRLKPGMVCVDIGANLGEVTLHMARRVRPGGTVYSFEPVSHIYRRLIEHIDRNGAGDIVQAVDVALSDTNGRVNLAFADEYGDNQGLGSVVNTRRRELTRRAVVRSYTLDSFAEEHALRRIDFMKIDIQGGEWLLLQGAKRVLSEIGPDLLIELSPLDLMEIGKDSRQLADLIEEFGYRIYPLFGNGMPGPCLRASAIDPAFSAANVFCTKHNR